MQIHPLYMLAGLLFIVHQLLQKVGQVSIPLVDHYLDPLLCMPLLLGLRQWEQQLLYGRKINTAECWILTFLLTLLFEIGFPRWSAQFTADWRDALLYGIGTLIFLMVNRGRPLFYKYRVSS